MEFLLNNCIRKIRCPKFSFHRFHYSSEMNLIASFHFLFDELTIWNPDTGEIVQEFELTELDPTDVLFLPDRHIGVAWVFGEFPDADADCGIVIYSIDSAEPIFNLVQHYSNPSINRRFTGIAALTPQNNLIFAGDIFIELIIDFNEKVNKEKIKSKKEIGKSDRNIMYLCCSKYNYTVCYSSSDDTSIKCLDAEFPSDSQLGVNSDLVEGIKATVRSEEAISYCYVNGQRKFLTAVRGLAHDGENIIVATKDEIIAVEAATNGSIGHVIVSKGIKTWSSNDSDPVGQIRVMKKGHLMVSNESEVIKVYKYQGGVSTLQGLCRHQINMMLKHRKDKVESLPITKIMKNYLLYKA